MVAITRMNEKTASRGGAVVAYPDGIGSGALAMSCIYPRERVPSGRFRRYVKRACAPDVAADRLANRHHLHSGGFCGKAAAPADLWVLKSRTAAAVHVSVTGMPKYLQRYKLDLHTSATTRSFRAATVLQGADILYLRSS